MNAPAAAQRGRTTASVPAVTVAAGWVATMGL
jgi:hypothetical protein